MLKLDPKLVALLRRFKVVPEKARQQRAGGPGAHMSKGLGQSLDFSEYRPYQAGDDLRALDWKVYGRSDKLYTKLYVPEQEETICFLLDTSASMAQKWSYLKQVVLALSTVVFQQGDRVTVMALGQDGAAPTLGVPPVRGRSNLARIASFLESSQAAGVTEIDEAARLAAKRLKSRVHIIVVSDFLKPGAGVEGLSQLHYRRHRLSLIQLLSPEEMTPDKSFSPGEWEFFDPEPEESNLEEPDLTRLELGRSAFTLYQKQLSIHNTLLSDFSRKTGAVYALGATDRSLIEFFSEDLRKSGLLI